MVVEELKREFDDDFEGDRLAIPGGRRKFPLFYRGQR